MPPVPYGQLVRDEVPRILTQRHIAHETRIAPPDERWTLIGEKLQEKAVDLLLAQDQERLIDALVDVRTLLAFGLFVVLGGREQQNAYLLPYLEQEASIKTWQGTVLPADLLPLVEAVSQATTKGALGKAAAALLVFDARLVKTRRLSGEAVRQRLLDKRQALGDYTKGYVLQWADDGFAALV